MLNCQSSNIPTIILLRYTVLQVESNMASNKNVEQTEHGAQVVNVTEDHKYILDEEELRRVLMRDDIKDLPVVVVSVAGPARTGKSFVLNFFLRYFKSSVSARADGSWLGENSEPLVGFSWSGGAKRNTVGLLFWSEPFVTTMASGEKVVVLLMDTQGTFDSTSTMRDCSTIFALSTLLSSVQIYNVSRNIQEDHLQHLQLFTEYGKLVKRSSGKAFQVLEFLVRDWQFPDDFAYGTEGGDKLLAERLQVTSHMAQEMIDLRTHIRSCFDKLSCFLMPHPGFKIFENASKGCIKYIESEFREYLIILAASLFGPQKLQPKLINGERVKARELFAYFKTYLDLFNSDKIPTPTNIMKATSEAGLMTAYLECLEQYGENMTRECGEKELCVPPVDIKVLHDRYKSSARTTFVNKKKMGDQKDVDEYLEKLLQEIDKRAKEFILINSAKQHKIIESAKAAYDRDIAKESNGELFCVHPADLDVIHKSAIKTALKVFDAARKRFTQERDEERNRFEQTLEKKFDLLKLNNDNNNVLAIGDSRKIYWEYMEVKSSVNPALTSLELEQENNLGRLKALEAFKKKRNRPDSYDQDVYKSRLYTAMTQRYIQIKKLNRTQNKAKLTAALHEYNRYIDNAWNHITQCLHPDDLDNEHATAVCKALKVFRPSKSCSDGFNYADEDEKSLQSMLNDRYLELLELNVVANNAAVRSAMNVYNDTIEDRETPNAWWLAVVPIVVYIAKSISSKYHEESKEDALAEFYSKRRNRGNEATDRFRIKLLKMIEERRVFL